MITSFFSKAPPPTPRAGGAMLTPGKEIVHLASNNPGRVVKLARNSKSGVIEAHIRLDNGSFVAGSPSLGKDFGPAQAPINADAQGGGGQPQPNRWSKFLDAPGGASAAAAERQPYVAAQAQPASTPCHSQNTQNTQSQLDPAFLSPPANKEASRNAFAKDSSTPQTMRKEPPAASAEQARNPFPQFEKPPAPAASSMPYVGNPFPTLGLGKRPLLAEDPPLQAKLAKFTSQASVPPPSSRGALHNPPSAPRKSHGGAPSGRGGGKAPGAASAPKQSFWWWLEEAHLTDSQRRPPSDPDYDQTTVHIPSSIWSEMTDFQHQYWAFKKVNFDTLIFAKLGKFYEMYCLDAEVGHRVLNLNFTHGGTDPNRPKQMLCVGVPQASLEGVVSKLVPLGYKVGIVEEMERSSDVKKVVGKKGSIVRRELRKVYTPGTLVSGEQLGGHEARPLLMIRPDDWDSRSMDQRTFGVCIVDCTTGQFTLGEASLLEVEVLLRAHRPHEILHEHGRLSPSIKTWLRHAAPLAVFSQQQRGELDGEMWRAETTLFRLGDYLGDLQEWPAALRNVSSGKPLALDAVGGVISYLKKLDLDRELVSLRAFAGLDDTSSTGGQAVMMLDAQTLTGLDVLESGDRLPIPGAEVTCLWHHLDRASTPFGRRLLRWWVTRPLVNAADIEGRLDAVDDLLGPASGILDLGHKLRKLPDLERKITRIHAHSLASQAQGVAEAATAQKKGVKELISCIDGFSEADRLRQHLTEAGSAAKSPLIRRLLARLPNLSAPLNDLSSRFDLQAARAAAAQKGDSQLSLHEGTDEAWDQAQGNMQAAEADLQEYIFAEKKRTGCVRMKFSGGSTSPYLLEVPADFPASRIPPEYMVLATTKSVKRYSNDLLLRLVDSLSEAQDQVDTAQREVVRTLCSVFHKHWAKWRLTVETLAEIDAVCALARASMGDDGLTMCRPEIHPAGEAGKPRLRVTGMRHPFLRCGGAFVPNDIQLGDGSGPESAALITGPNMGGKSTVLRLTCFAAIIAQLGCYVPAERMEISPVDQIFTRLGANDDLMRGRSTFLVELLDVSAMLSRATRDSLVIIDELGRGTSTFDGHAIAFGVFHDLIRLECRTLLSTHYHGLSQDFEHNAAVVPLHMDCRIDPVRPGELVMLYKLRKGVCPQSHGMECALSAGLPKSLVGRAREKAASFERSVATRGPKSKPPKSHDAGGAWDLRGDAAREREREMDVDEHETLSGPVVKPADAERFAAICLALGAIDALPTSNANTHLDCSQALAPYAALSALWVA